MGTAAHHSDVLIIGSGLAGLQTALELAEHGRVHLVTKRALTEANTRYAQGGIAAAIGDEDSVEEHVADTLRAGAGLCDEAAVRSILADGPERIRALAAIGVPFTRSESGSLSLGQEGGHSARRVVFSADRTGQAVEDLLADAVRRHPQIHVFENHLAVDLVLDSRAGGVTGVPVGQDRCIGAFVLDAEAQAVRTFLAPVTVLATGGAGKTYKFTSNPDIATGDGLAMAFRAGLPLANLEFVQFHPTCLYHHVARSFLISEATRGEGATLTSMSGDRFMLRYDERGELASRDIVARAIDAELKQSGDPYVLLHLEHLDADVLRRRFPHIHEQCLRVGMDVTQQPIPVVPAAHYMCGGIVTDLAARTALPGLLAIGEVASTGLHGANRLASNSLLEALVMAPRAAAEARRQWSALGGVAHSPEWEAGRAVRVREAIVLEHDWNHVRALMWDYVGIVRSDDRLSVASERMRLLRRTIQENYFRRFVITPDLVELRNLVLVGELIIASAMTRPESRGLHYNVDHPQPEPAMAHATTIVRKGAEPALHPMGTVV